MNTSTLKYELERSKIRVIILIYLYLQSLFVTFHSSFELYLLFPYHFNSTLEYISMFTDIYTYYCLIFMSFLSLCNIFCYKRTCSIIFITSSYLQ